MPICIPRDLPARKTLESEGIFVIDEHRATTQDIRPLRAVILNLMPTKIATETQLLRLLGISPLQVEVDLLQTESYTSKNTPLDHLLKFYTTFSQIRHNRYDMMIVTGAPVETMAFSDVTYWNELCDIFDWARDHVFSSLFICWGAQAALNYYYGVPKHPLDAKRFGVFESFPTDFNHPLMRGFSDSFYVPHSHHTEVRAEDLVGIDGLQLLAGSPEAGPDLVVSGDLRRIFQLGHIEYDSRTLATEYERDVAAQLPIQLPCNYYKNNDPAEGPVNRWKSTASLFYANWINAVYQLTPFDLESLGR